MKPNDLRILDALATPSTSGELSKSLGISPTTVSKWIARLQEDGYVRMVDKRPGKRRPHYVWALVRNVPNPAQPGRGYRTDPLLGALFA